MTSESPTVSQPAALLLNVTPLETQISVSSVVLTNQGGLCRQLRGLKLPLQKIVDLDYGAVFTDLLSRGVDPTLALMAAIRGGRLDLAKIALDHGANANVGMKELFPSRKTVILLDDHADAHKECPPELAPQFALLLLEHEASPEVGLVGALLEHRKELVKLFLSRRADPNVGLLKFDLLTMDEVQRLLDHGADLDFALQFFFMREQWDTLEKVLLLGGDINIMIGIATTLGDQASIDLIKKMFPERVSDRVDPELRNRIDDMRYMTMEYIKVGLIDF
jgi:hypothetical protein